jgi:hypothetical protein
MNETADPRKPGSEAVACFGIGGLPRRGKQQSQDLTLTGGVGVRPELNRMKANLLRTNWLIPVLGIALVGGGYPLAKSYLRFSEEIRAESQSGAIVDCLLEDYNLSRVLMQLQSGDCAAPARSLDELLSANIMTINSQLASVDPQTRAVAEACFDHMGRQRAQSLPLAAGLVKDGSSSEIAARGNLAQALASGSRGR